MSYRLRPPNPLVSLIALLSLGGCMALGGTFLDEQCNKVYIGTSIDLSCITSGGHNIASAPLCLVDLPFSIVLDTVFLPYTIPASLGSCARSEVPKARSSHASEQGARFVSRRDHGAQGPD